MPINFLNKIIKNQEILDVRIKILEIRVNPYVEDEIRAGVHGIQTCLDSFESQLMAKKNSTRFQTLALSPQS